MLCGINLRKVHIHPALLTNLSFNCIIHLQKICGHGVPCPYNNCPKDGFGTRPYTFFK